MAHTNVKKSKQPEPVAVPLTPGYPDKMYGKLPYDTVLGLCRLATSNALKIGLTVDSPDLDRDLDAILTMAGWLREEFLAEVNGTIPTSGTLGN